MRHSRTAVALLVSLLAIPAAAAITGTVINADGQPVAGARVMIHSIETPTARRERLLTQTPQLPALAETQTDAKGAFSLPSPKEPVVDLRVEMRGYAPESRRIEKDEELGAVALAARQMRTGTITAGGKPVPNATVVITYSGAEYVARTDANGKYEAPELKRAGIITVLHPDFAVDEELLLNASSPDSELTRTLSTGTALSGRVVAADGKTPVDKAVITIDQWPVATTAEDGSFVVAHTPSRWSNLTARKDTLIGTHAFAGGKPVTVRVERYAVISGRVLDSKSKVPVPGATVRVNPNRRMSAGVDLSRMAITDAKGSFSIPTTAGTFMLVATHPAFELRPADVTVSAGQQLSRDLQLNQLARVSGVVVDEEGRPVPAARVSAEGSGREQFQMVMSRDGAVTTGMDGRFSLRLRADNDFRLRAAKKGMPDAKGESARYTAGERKSGIVLTIPSGVGVTGRVLDPSGEPLSGVAVKATETPAGSERSMMMRRVVFSGMMEEEEDLVRTASDGTFTVRLKEGTYDFAFKREGFAQKSVRAQNVTPNGTQPIETRLDPAVEVTGRVTRGGMGVPDVSVSSFGETEAMVVTGPDGSFTLGGLSPGSLRLMLRKEDAFINEQRAVTAPAQDVNIELPVGVTVRGRVIEKGSRKPIASFQAGVSASRSGGAMVMMSPPLLKNFTTDDGSFTLENVPTGAMNLVATAPGYAAARTSLDVQEGKPINDLVIELETGVRLTGKVTGPNGTPLADAMVGVQPSPTGSFAMTGSLRRTATDSNGEYSLDGLEPGEETIQVMHPKYNPTSKSVTLKGAETKLDIQLEGGRTVTGVVVTDSGMPVPDAQVNAFSAAGGGHGARTNTSGAFEIESMPPGRYRFTAEKSGYVEAMVNDVDIASGTPVRLVLQTGGTIYGRVTGVSEADLANVMVTARGGRASSSASVDPQGNYRLEGAPTGTVAVSATVQPRNFTTRRSSATQTVEVAAGASQQVNIDFRGDVVIRGRITRNGAPLGGASVSFYQRKSGSQSSASVAGDEQGMYSVSGLEEGEYQVSVTDMQRFSPYTTTYNIRGSATFDIDFRAGTVRGRVLDSGTNEPIGNVNVQFRTTTPGTEMRATRAALSDANGNFSLDFVHPGSYVITAGREGYGNVVQEMSFTDAGRDDLELRLSRNDGVALNIVDARDGRTLSAQVIVFDAQGRVVHDSRGMFRFGDAAKEMRLPLAPGTYQATIFVPEYAARHVSITSPSSPTVTVTPGGSIVVRSKHNIRRRMRVLDASGMVYPRFSVMPFTRDLPPGTLPIEHVAPGSYTLVLLNDDESPAATVPVVVREGETVTVDL